MKIYVLTSILAFTSIAASVTEGIPYSCERKAFGVAHHLYRTNYFHEVPLGGQRMILVERLSTETNKYFEATFPSSPASNATAERYIAVKISLPNCLIVEVKDLQK